MSKIPPESPALTPMRVTRRGFLGSVAGLAALSQPTSGAAPAAKKRIVFVAGVKTHGYGEHAHDAGCLFLAKCLNENVPGVEAVVHRDGWPSDPTFFDGASTVVLYMDGGDKHPILPHLDEMDRLMKQGVGLAALHYAVVMPKGEAGDRFLDWIGGYYETYWSVNPEWTARFTKLPPHPITRGVKPFAIHDEWYYHMRFRPNMEGVTPILTAVPPDKTREGEFGPHSGNAVVRAERGHPEHMAWAYQRAGGGRGFGFTGAHYHWAWENDDYRKLVLNAIAWTARLDVPASGIPSRTPAWDDLLANQEGQMPEGFNREKAQQLIRAREE